MSEDGVGSDSSMRAGVGFEDELWGFGSRYSASASRWRCGKGDGNEEVDGHGSCGREGGGDSEILSFSANVSVGG